MKYSNYKKKPGFFAGKGFYIVLVACIVAVGIAAWSAVSTISSTDEGLVSSQNGSKLESIIKPNSSTEDVGQTVSDVPVPSSSEVLTSSQETESQNSSKQEYPTPASPKFAVPLTSANIGKTFSDSELQYSATYGDMRLHLGVDLQANEGEKVMSAAAGDVKKVASDALWGKMVVIDHGNNIICYYCGLENTTVTEGETISAGTVIGEVGKVPCESADKAHIHIAITRDGKYISPLDLMKQ